MSIQSAMLNVAKKVGYVQKEGKVSFGNTKYSYAGEADLIRALRPVMIEEGIIFYPTAAKVIQADRGMLTGEYCFRFHHIATDTYIDVPAIGQGADAGDKGAYKAATGALKYALRQAFLIETGDDPDKTSSEEIQANSAKAYEAAKEKFKVPVPKIDGTNEDDWHTWHQWLMDTLHEGPKTEEYKSLVWKANKPSFLRLQQIDPVLHDATVKDVSAYFMENIA